MILKGGKDSKYRMNGMTFIYCSRSLLYQNASVEVESNVNKGTTLPLFLQRDFRTPEIKHTMKSFFYYI